VRRGKALNVDVTVHFESGDDLGRGEAEEVSNYQHLVDYFISKGNVIEARVLPIFVGSR
jgi:hypothetical protein